MLDVSHLAYANYLTLMVEHGYSLEIPISLTANKNVWAGLNEYCLNGVMS